MRPPREPYPAVLTAPEVAELLRFSSKTIHRWAQSGQIPAFRTLGQRGQWRFRREDIEHLIGSRALPPR